MKFFPLGLAVPCALLVCSDTIGFGQSPEQAPGDAVRVTMSMHPDGSQTVYNFDNAQHKAVATTTGQDGKVRETIRYVLDDAGRFSSAEVAGADGRVRLKSRTSTTMLAAYSKRLKVHRTALFCTRLCIATTHPGNRQVIPYLMPREN